ncbi:MULTISPECIES: sugar phosphate nucleotidyltransferase [unclassified Brevundimonas]|uniref:sugar phosphate nucleotidyltransferase n=1 Tax=unclassified Brevundimonas TaxID=2622653 RepID=UPI0025BFEB09|nr:MULTISPECIES: sugar phosphate nucleotidyltransferase [unclassified Brevundimonas]
MNAVQIRQAVILCGGIGSRLGELTKSTPKPLLPVAGRPFLAFLLDRLRAEGLDRFLLLAAFENEQIKAFARSYMQSHPGTTIEVAVEPGRVGTGGAIWHAREALDERFYLLNGDSWLNAPLRDLDGLMTPSVLGVLSLRHVDDRTRYGAVETDGDTVTVFGGSGSASGPGYINGGVYLFDRSIVEFLPEDGSLEQMTLPPLALEGQLRCVKRDCYFIDIGVIEDFDRAQTELLAQI